MCSSFFIIFQNMFSPSPQILQMQKNLLIFFLKHNTLRADNKQQTQRSQKMSVQEMKPVKEGKVR